MTAAASPLPSSAASLAELLPAAASFPSLVSRHDVRLEIGSYVARLARDDRDRIAAFRLRFLVFNLEMHEGLESAFVNGYDIDHYDEVCDHLIVEEKATGEIIGTYRLQTGPVAARSFGYYSEQEFDFAPFEAMRPEIVELGRACIHRSHRCPEVLHLLWRAIARYSLANGGRYMIGCCSLTSQDAQVGHAVYQSLLSYRVPEALRTSPTAAFRLPPCPPAAGDVKAPKLLRAYLTLGAKICGEPAIDRDFKTIDFLTLLDLQALHPRMATRFLDFAG